MMTFHLKCIWLNDHCIKTLLDLLGDHLYSESLHWKSNVIYMSNQLYIIEGLTCLWLTVDHVIDILMSPVMECPSDRPQRPGMVMWFLLSLECRPDKDLRVTLIVTCSLPVFLMKHTSRSTVRATRSLNQAWRYALTSFLVSRLETDFGMWDKLLN